MPPLVPTLSGARRQAAEAGEKPLLVGIKGQYYDITEFAKRHPGGDIIYDWVGGDATEVRCQMLCLVWAWVLLWNVAAAPRMRCGLIGCIPPRLTADMARAVVGNPGVLRLPRPRR